MFLYHNVLYQLKYIVYNNVYYSIQYTVYRLLFINQA